MAELKEESGYRRKDLLRRLWSYTTATEVAGQIVADHQNSKRTKRNTAKLISVLLRPHYAQLPADILAELKRAMLPKDKSLKVDNTAAGASQKKAESPALSEGMKSYRKGVANVATVLKAIPFGLTLLPAIALDAVSNGMAAASQSDRDYENRSLTAKVLTPLIMPLRILVDATVFFYCNTWAFAFRIATTFENALKLDWDRTRESAERAAVHGGKTVFVVGIGMGFSYILSGIDPLKFMESIANLVINPVDAVSSLAAFSDFSVLLAALSVTLATLAVVGVTDWLYENRADIHALINGEGNDHRRVTHSVTTEKSFAESVTPENSVVPIQSQLAEDGPTSPAIVRPITLAQKECGSGNLIRDSQGTDILRPDSPEGSKVKVEPRADTATPITPPSTEQEPGSAGSLMRKDSQETGTPTPTPTRPITPPSTEQESVSGSLMRKDSQEAGTPTPTPTRPITPPSTEQESVSGSLMRKDSQEAGTPRSDSPSSIYSDDSSGDVGKKEADPSSAGTGNGQELNLSWQHKQKDPDLSGISEAIRFTSEYQAAVITGKFESPSPSLIPPVDNEDPGKNDSVYFTKRS